MAHPLQKEFCLSVKNLYPQFFTNKDVLDVGALDINGNNRYLFEECTFTGIDVGPGPNVDIVCPAHSFNPGKQYDVIVTTEMLEHDKYWHWSLRRMYDLLKPGGLLLLTCAGYGRYEHGTTRTSPPDSPFTNDYYCNRTIETFAVLIPDETFVEYAVSKKEQDIRFYGIKR